jgi:hypothetical protein
VGIPSTPEPNTERPAQWSDDLLSKIHGQKIGARATKSSRGSTPALV